MSDFYKQRGFGEFDLRPDQEWKQDIRDRVLKASLKAAAKVAEATLGQCGSGFFARARAAYRAVPSEYRAALSEYRAFKPLQNTSRRPLIASTARPVLFAFRYEGPSLDVECDFADNRNQSIHIGH